MGRNSQRYNAYAKQNNTIMKISTWKKIVESSTIGRGIPIGIESTKIDKLRDLSNAVNVQLQEYMYNGEYLAIPDRDKCIGGNSRNTQVVLYYLYIRKEELIKNDLLNNFNFTGFYVWGLAYEPDMLREKWEELVRDDEGLVQRTIQL